MAINNRNDILRELAKGPIPAKFRARDASQAEFAASNPVLEPGEIVADPSTGEQWIGDGVTPFSDLSQPFTKKAQSALSLSDYLPAGFNHATDDAAPYFKAAIDAAASRAIPEVVVEYHATGYLLATAYDTTTGTLAITQPNTATGAVYNTCIPVKSNIAIRGSGGRVKLRLANGMMQSGGRTYINVFGSANATAGVANVTIENFDIDLNASGQPVATSNAEHFKSCAVNVFRGLNWKLNRVTGRNSSGDTFGLPANAGESFMFNFGLAVDTRVTDCHAINQLNGTTPTGGSAFGVNASYRTSFVGCTAVGFAWVGFTDNSAGLNATNNLGGTANNNAIKPAVDGDGQTVCIDCFVSDSAYGFNCEVSSMRVTGCGTDNMRTYAVAGLGASKIVVTGGDFANSTLTTHPAVQLTTVQNAVIVGNRFDKFVAGVAGDASTNTNHLVFVGNDCNGCTNQTAGQGLGGANVVIMGNTGPQTTPRRTFKQDSFYIDNDVLHAHTTATAGTGIAVGALSSDATKRVIRFGGDTYLYRLTAGRLRTDGDFEISLGSAPGTKGLILLSPDNNRWRITVANGGAIQASLAN